MDPVPALALALLALLGLLIGAVLDGVVTRVPAGASVRSAVRPQCACGSPRHGRDALPLLWLTQPDRRCPACGEASGVRRAALELGCAVAFVTLGLVLPLSWQLPAYLYLAALGLALTAIDLATRRLPDVLTIPAYPIFGALLLVPTVVDDLWGSYARAALGGVALFGVYLLLAVINPAGMGLGDVKLSGVLGIAMAWFGWSAWMLGTVAAFLLSAAVSIGLLVSRRADRHSLIPFGPFMVAGAFLGIVTGATGGGLLLASGALG